MGIPDFIVTAEKATAPATAPSPAALQPVAEGPWRHFVCVVPEPFGLRAPVHANTLEMENFKSNFQLSVALQGLQPSTVLSVGEELTLAIGAEQVTHPDRILADQPILGSLRNAVQLLDRCLGRKIDHADFLRALNEMGLPLSWRNELANGVFSAVASKTSASEPVIDADIEALLSSLGTTGLEPNAPAAAHFISEVGKAGTGFALNALEARRFRDGLEEWLRDLERGLLAHPAAAGPMGLALALNRLLKRIRGPQHLHFHLLPESLSPQAYQAHWQTVLAQHPGSVEAWIYLAADSAAAQLPPEAWQTRLAASPVPILVQARQSATPEWIAWGKTLPAPVFVFIGGVAAAVDGNHCFWKPAALVYLEAMLAQQARLPEAAGMQLALEDADVDPGTRSSADTVYDATALIALRSRGLNPAVGSKNRAGIVFPPLIPAVEAH